MCGFRVNSDCHGSKLIAARLALPILLAHARCASLFFPASSSLLRLFSSPRPSQFAICKKMHDGLLLLEQKMCPQSLTLVFCPLRANNAVVTKYIRSMPFMCARARARSPLIPSPLLRSQITTRSYQCEHIRLLVRRRRDVEGEMR